MKVHVKMTVFCNTVWLKQLSSCCVYQQKFIRTSAELNAALQCSGSDSSYPCINSYQWRRQLWGTGARATPPSTSKSESQLSKYCVVCEISWCRCQRLTAHSISTTLVTTLLVIEPLLHLSLKFTVRAPWHNFNLPLLATNPGDATDSYVS